MSHDSFFDHLKSLHVLYDPTATSTHQAQSIAYSNLIILTVISVLICLLLVTASYVLSYSTVKNAEQASEYECGFDPFDTATRRPFEVHFYVVGILFLIFDVEIALIFPWVLSLNATSWFGFYMMLIFLLVVTVGFIAEWHRGVLTWPKHVVSSLLLTAVSNTSCDPADFSCSSCLTAPDLAPGLDPATTALMPLTIEFQLAQADQVIYKSDIPYFLLDGPIISYTVDSYWYALPEILCLIFILLVVLLASAAYRLCTPKNIQLLVAKQTNLTIRLLYLVFATYTWLLAYHVNVTTRVLIFGSNVVVDYYTTMSKAAIVLLVILVLRFSRIYLMNHTQNMLDYPTYILLGTFFLLVLVSSNNFMTVLFGIMGFSYNLYVLLAADAGKEAMPAAFCGTRFAVAPVHADKAISSTEAAIKYFTLSALSSGLIAAALSLLWLFAGTLNFGKITWLITRQLRSIVPAQDFVSLWDFILIFLMYGFLFKLAAYPCHLWAPDVYSGTPGPILSFVMLPVKLGVFAIFTRLLLGVFRDFYGVWSLLLVMAAAGSLIWGCLGAYKTYLVKKFLAYSSMNQIGFVLASTACCSAAGLFAALAFLLVYFLSQVLIFQFILNVYKNTPVKLYQAPAPTTVLAQEITYLHEFQLASWGINRRPYILGLCIIFFSMAGVPPLAGFYSKYLVFSAVFKSGYNSLVLTCMVTSMVSTYYYLRVIKIMTFGLQPLSSLFGTFGLDQTKWYFDISTAQTRLYFIILTIILLFPGYYTDFANTLKQVVWSGIFR